MSGNFETTQCDQSQGVYRTVSSLISEQHRPSRRSVFPDTRFNSAVPNGCEEPCRTHAERWTICHEVDLITSGGLETIKDEKRKQTTKDKQQVLLERKVID